MHITPGLHLYETNIAVHTAGSLLQIYAFYFIPVDYLLWINKYSNKMHGPRSRIPTVHKL